MKTLEFLYQSAIALKDRALYQWCVSQGHSDDYVLEEIALPESALKDFGYRIGQMIQMGGRYCVIVGYEWESDRLYLKLLVDGETKVRWMGKIMELLILL